MHCPQTLDGFKLRKVICVARIAAEKSTVSTDRAGMIRKLTVAPPETCKITNRNRFKRKPGRQRPPEKSAY